MKYGALKTTDIANGEGVRVSLWVSGCNRHCPGCFNPEAQSFEYGEEVNASVVNQIAKALGRSYISGLTILGGEPMEPDNIPGVFALLYMIKKAFKDERTVWLYTGYKYEEIATSPILAYVDVLVDGEFIENQHEAGLVFKGSKNQRIIDVRETERSGSVKLWRSKYDKTGI